MSRDLGRTRDQSVIRLYGLELCKVSHHPTKFGDQMHCVSGDIMVLVFHVITMTQHDETVM